LSIVMVISIEDKNSDITSFYNNIFVQKT